MGVLSIGGTGIHEQLQLLGGIENIKVDPQKWMISDDTVMHIATAEALISKWAKHEELFHALAMQYQLCMKDMTGRAPGLTCRSYRPHPEAWSERWVCNSV